MKPYGLPLFWAVVGALLAWAVTPVHESMLVLPRLYPQCYHRHHRAPSVEHWWDKVNQG